MIAEKPEYAEMVEALYAACTPLSRGDLLPHATIREILGVEPNVGHWQRCVNRLRRRMLRERRIAMWPELTLGYRLLTVNEQLDLSRERLLRSRRQVKRGMREVEALPATGLSLHQRRARLLKSEALRRSHLELTQELNRQEVLFRATQGNPRPRPAACVAE